MATNVEFVEEMYMKFNNGDIPAVTDGMAEILYLGADHTPENS